MSNEERKVILHDLLYEAYQFLNKHGEDNWIKGIKAALSELDNNPEQGYENACSIYKNIVSGGRGFSEFNIYHEDQACRVKENSEIDTIREKLWRHIVE